MVCRTSEPRHGGDNAKLKNNYRQQNTLPQAC